MAKLKIKLPGLYHQFLPDFIEQEFPEEKLATCANCNLCQSPKSPYINTKCCSYYPHLANYLIGGILQDESSFLEEGKRRIRELIRNKNGVTPYGIIPPNWYKEASKEKDLEEKNRTLTAQKNDIFLCPYYDKGNCTVWEYRENLCSTFFCNSIGGKIGKDFWKKTNEYLKMVENSLSLYALHQLGYQGSKIKTTDIQDRNFEDDAFNEENYSNLWHNWEGKEEELYIKSYTLINALDESSFRSICGYKQKILAESIAQLLEEFKNNLIPDILILNPSTKVEKLNDTEIRLSINEDSMVVSPIIYSHIQKFNGKTTNKEIIDLAFRLIINMESIIDELYKKNFITELKKISK